MKGTCALGRKFIDCPQRGYLMDSLTKRPSASFRPACYSGVALVFSLRKAFSTSLKLW